MYVLLWSEHNNGYSFHQMLSAKNDFCLWLLNLNFWAVTCYWLVDFLFLTCLKAAPAPQGLVSEQQQIHAVQLPAPVEADWARVTVQTVHVQAGVTITDCGPRRCSAEESLLAPFAQTADLMCATCPRMDKRASGATPSDRPRRPTACVNQGWPFSMCTRPVLQAQKVPVCAICS